LAAAECLGLGPADDRRGVARPAGSRVHSLKPDHHRAHSSGFARRPRIGKATLRIGLRLSLVVLAAFPFPAQAKDGPPGPDGLPVASPKHPWNTFTGASRVDTLSFGPDEVLPVASRQFEIDQWEVFTVDAGQGAIVTRWKQMHHPLLFLFAGRINARCTVTMQPVGSDRTRMVFRADLASHDNLEDSPILGPAKRAYAKAAKDYFSKVRSALNSGATPTTRAVLLRRMPPHTNR
jgi:hypothetical protein